MDYYQILGVDPKATHEEIQKAYRAKSLEHHPDRGGDIELFKQIEEAASILLDPEKRARFDANGFYKPAPTKAELWAQIGAVFINECNAVDSDSSILNVKSLYSGRSRFDVNVMDRVRETFNHTNREHASNIKKLERRVKHWNRVRRSVEKQNADKMDSEGFQRFVAVIDGEILGCKQMIQIAKNKFEFGTLALKEMEGLEFSKIFRGEEDDSSSEGGFVNRRMNFITGEVT